MHIPSYQICNILKVYSKQMTQSKTLEHQSLGIKSPVSDKISKTDGIDKVTNIDKSGKSSKVGEISKTGKTENNNISSQGKREFIINKVSNNFFRY